MNIGIKFQIPNKWDKLIESILNGIELKKYIWKINEDDVYIKDTMKNNGFLFPQEKNIFNGEEFIKIISQRSYYTVFINIEAYLSENDFHNIKTYNDFITSNCEIIILTSDNIFVNIYAKSEKIIQQIETNAMKNKYEQIEYITDENLKLLNLAEM